MWFVLFLPVLVYVLVFYANCCTISRGKIYESDNIVWLIAWQVMILVVILSLSITILAYSNAMSERWKSAFFRINPERECIQQMSFRRWAKLPGEAEQDRPLESLTSTLVDSVSVDRALKTDEVTAESRLGIKNGKISRDDLGLMAKEIFDKGRSAAEAVCAIATGREFVELVEFKVRENIFIVDSDEWIVQGKWKYKYRDQVMSKEMRKLDESTDAEDKVA